MCHGNAKLFCCTTLFFLLGTGCGVLLWMIAIAELRVVTDYAPANCTVLSKQLQSQHVVGNWTQYRAKLSVAYNVTVLGTPATIAVLVGNVSHAVTSTPTTTRSLHGTAYDTLAGIYTVGVDDKREFLARYNVSATTTYPCYYDRADMQHVSMTREPPWYMFLAFAAPAAVAVLGIVGVCMCPRALLPASAPRSLPRRPICCKAFGCGSLLFLVGVGFGLLLWIYVVSNLRMFTEYQQTTCYVTGKEQQQQMWGTTANAPVAYRAVVYAEYVLNGQVVRAHAYDAVDGQFSLGEKTGFLDRFLVNETYACFYDTQFLQHVVFERELLWYIVVILAIPVLLFVGGLTLVICVPNILGGPRELGYVDVRTTAPTEQVPSRNTYMVQRRPTHAAFGASRR